MSALLFLVSFVVSLVPKFHHHGWVEENPLMTIIGMITYRKLIYLFVNVFGRDKCAAGVHNGMILQFASGEELSALMPSVLDRVFRGGL